MLPSVRATGVQQALELLAGVRARLHDSSPAFELVADDVFAFERRWWQLTYGGREDREQRSGRNPRYMHETGALERSATVRGSARQVVDVGGTYVFIGVTSGLAEIHEAHGRPVLGEPSRREGHRMVERVGNYIMTGRADG